MSGLIPKDEYIDVIAATTGALKDESLRNRFIALGFEYITLRVEHDRATPPRAEVDVASMRSDLRRILDTTTTFGDVDKFAVLGIFDHLMDRYALSSPMPTDARDAGGV